MEWELGFFKFNDDSRVIGTNIIVLFCHLINSTHIFGNWMVLRGHMRSMQYDTYLQQWIEQVQVQQQHHWLVLMLPPHGLSPFVHSSLRSSVPWAHLEYHLGSLSSSLLSNAAIQDEVQNLQMVGLFLLRDCMCKRDWMFLRDDTQRKVVSTRY